MRPRPNAARDAWVAELLAKSRPLTDEERAAVAALLRRPPAESSRAA